jgi:hypothetical protein
MKGTQLEGVGCPLFMKPAWLGIPKKHYVAAMWRHRPLRRLGVSAAAIAILVSGTIATDSGAATKSTAPSLKEAYRVLVRNAGVSIVTNESCMSVKEPGDTTIADYLATLASRQADKSINWHTEVRNKAAGNNWETSIHILGSDAGDKYDMGVRIVIDGSTRRMVRGSFQCIGSS